MRAPYIPILAQKTSLTMRCQSIETGALVVLRAKGQSVKKEKTTANREKCFTTFERILYYSMQKYHM